MGGHPHCTGALAYQAAALTSMQIPECATANVAAIEGPDLPEEVLDLLTTLHRVIKNFNSATHWEQA